MTKVMGIQQTIFMTKYVDFIERNNGLVVWNKIYGSVVGVIKNSEKGFGLCIINEETGYSNGCLKDIIPFLQSLGTSRDYDLISFAGDSEYLVYNENREKPVGLIKKARMGRWMHWQLFTSDRINLFGENQLMAISKFITKLYSRR